MSNSVLEANEAENKCLALAVEYIQNNWEKLYKMTEIRMLEGPSSRNIAVNVLLGNNATKKYDACLAENSVKGKSR